MQEGFTDFCDDNFLIDSSEQDTETDCLLHCESTGDPGKWFVPTWNVAVWDRGPKLTDYQS